MNKTAVALIVGLLLIIAVAVLISSLPGDRITIIKEELDQASASGNGVITRQIEVNRGDSFEMSLYAHWSAGMKWSASFDGSGIVRQEGPREFTNDGPPLSTGSPGHEEWTFKAVAAGEATITLTYGSVAGLPDAPQSVNTLILVVEVR